MKYRNVQIFLPSNHRRGFTLIELLVVIGIIAILATATIPAIRNLSKSNDETQGVSLVRTMITAARGIAVQQHRITGVVFFEETAAYSSPVNGKQVAMQLIVEDFNQAQYQPITLPVTANALYMVAYSKSRQYLPVGMKVAALTDSATNTVDAAEIAQSPTPARVILFDASGQLLTRNQLRTDDPDLVDYTNPAFAVDTKTARTPGTYPMAMGDWKLLRPDGQLPGPLTTTPPPDATSSPGFFLYNHEELAAQNIPAGSSQAQLIANWIKQHASIILVNGNTGSVIVDKGNQ